VCFVTAVAVVCESVHKKTRGAVEMKMTKVTCICRPQPQQAAKSPQKKAAAVYCLFVFAIASPPPPPLIFLSHLFGVS
jgi:hypothetical protein